MISSTMYNTMNLFVFKPFKILSIRAKDPNDFSSMVPVKNITDIISDEEYRSIVINIYSSWEKPKISRLIDICKLFGNNDNLNRISIEVLESLLVPISDEEFCKIAGYDPNSRWATTYLADLLKQCKQFETMGGSHFNRLSIDVLEKLL